MESKSLREEAMEREWFNPSPSLESSLTSGLLSSDHDNKQEHEKAAKRGWRSVIYLVGLVFAEQFSICGVAANLITYLINEMHEPMGTAAKNCNIWSGVTTILPILGGLVADAYLGRCKTILISTCIYALGLVMLTFSVTIPLESQTIPFFISLYLVSIGQAGHSPCLNTFAADQFNDSSPEERKKKSAFFNWWYFGACIGGLTGTVIVVNVQDNLGWVWGFAIPAVGMVSGLVIFLFGRRSYKQHVPGGSPITKVIQVFVAAFRKRHVCVSSNRQDYLECCEDGETDMVTGVKGGFLQHTNQFKLSTRFVLGPFKRNIKLNLSNRFLDKGAIVDAIDALTETTNNWRLCSVSQVEEVKTVLGLVPIWLSCLMFTVVSAQGGTFFTKQGSTMDTSIVGNIHLSPASLLVVTNLAVILVVPIYDKIFVPVARLYTKLPSGITMLQRIGFGMLLATVEMVVAARVETRRIQIAIEHGLLDHRSAIVPMSVWWLLPQYIIWGTSIVFANIGLQELFYDQMPEKMRSIGSASFTCAFGVGSFLSSAIISWVQYLSSSIGDQWLGDNLNRAHLNYFYWLLAGLNTLGFCGFVVVAKFYVYNKVNVNASP